MRETVFFAGRWATNIALACLAIAASVKPEDAMSNLSGWADKFHLPTPSWLQSGTTDHLALVVAIGGLLVLWTGPVVWRHRHALDHLIHQKKPELTQAEIEAKIAGDPELSEFMKTAVREGLKSQDILVEEAIRPSIKLKFLRWRGFYRFFARPPFSFYWAQRRLEFIDAWKWFFIEHDKVIIPDLSDERKLRKARLTIATIYPTNQGPEAIYHLAMRPDDIKAQCEALFPPTPPKEAPKAVLKTTPKKTR